MGKTMMKASLVLVALALVALSPRAARATIPGVTPTPGTPSYDITAAPDVISTSDGDSMYMWLYGVSFASQYPGPTLIVNQGDTVTIQLTNLLPVATSIVFPGLSVTASGGSRVGLLAREADSGEQVMYQFTADRPGTYLYHSGTRPDLQVEMGLVGAIIVRPATFSATAACTPAVTRCRKAYGDNSTAYDREHLFLLTDADPLLHQAVAFASDEEIAAGFPSVDTSQRHAVDWFINGRNFPDTVANAGVGWMPTQPYNALPLMHPGEKVLMRVLGAGLDLHPFHTHGQNHLVIARDARVLSSNALRPGDHAADLAVSDYTTTSVPGETLDAIWGPWTGAQLGWDVFGTAPANPHTCTPDATGFDQRTREFCADHNKPFPVTLPSNPYLNYGPFYGGTPFLGVKGPLPPLNPDGTVHVQKNPLAGLSFMWHSHSERELTTNDVFIGGMATMALVLPMSITIP
jgi:FtsP/CotA-like multicopper oxidase with cupredoxin domain